METAAQRCVRIVSALEDLVAQESVALANRDFAAILALQERTAPLVDFLVETGPACLEQRGLQARVAALHQQRTQNSDSLATEIEHSRAELQQTQVTQRRVARIAPAYSQPAAARRQLQAVG